MNFLEMCVKFRGDVGISGSGPSSVVDQTGMNKNIVGWIADADEFIQMQWEDWKFLFVPKVVITALADTASFSPTDLGITDLARWKETKFVSKPGTSNYQRLKYDISFDEYLESDAYLNEVESGDPERVIVDPTDNSIIFYPVQETTLTVWGSYYRAVTRMTVNTSESLIPVRFQEAILCKATMYYATYMNNGALFDEAEMKFDEIMYKLEANQIPAFKGTQIGNDDNYEDIVVL